MGTKILIVDDEEEHRKLIQMLLERDRYDVASADRGDRAFDLAVKAKPDLILSDVAMPSLDGVMLCRRLKGDRRTAGIPIVLMSGRLKAESDQATGIETGADDYLIKPFSPRLLSAKVGAVLRRYASPGDLREVLKDHGLVLDVGARTAAQGGRRIQLSRKEFDLLTTFLRKTGRVLSISFLLEHVWGYDPADYNDPATVQVHISSLRKKLGPKLAKRIVSVPGLGYRFDA